MRWTRPSQFVITVCRCSAGISKISNRQSAVFLCGLVVSLLCGFTGGCSSWSSQAGAEQPSFEDLLSAPYDEAKLKKSLTLDVLGTIQRSRGELAPYFMGAELLSQSDDVVASSGQGEDGRRIWFNMVAFHELKLNVIRKYFFVVDDTVPTLRGKSRRGLRFDCAMALPNEMLEKSYADENARQIAVLRYVLERLYEDMDSLGSGATGSNGKTLDVCAMLINQTFGMILRRFDSSPATVAGLSQAEGVEFDHITFDKGTVRMATGGDTVAVKILFGIFAPQTKK